ncbi:MAG: hypothetical protein HGB11_12960, partial [Chlorobiales bacterium]|nr:hypothetical protein [Chlorobiales bacterium]
MGDSDKTGLIDSFERQIARLERRIKVMKKLSERYSWIRLSILAAGTFSFFLTQNIASNWVAWAVLLSSFFGFVLIAHRHQQLKARVLRHIIWKDIKLRQIARMRLDWKNIPQSPSSQKDQEHPFELDLNMAGKHSLHQLIDASSTVESSNLLRSWLLTPELNPDALQT